MLVLLAALAMSAEEPCYGHAYEQRLEGEHFWVEWPEGNGVTPLRAQFVLDALEAARATYVDALGWPAPDESIVVTLDDPQVGSAGGYTKTVDCDDGPAVRMFVYRDAVINDQGPPIAAHELGHAFEYQYTGVFTNAVSAWAWWTEGTAVWFEHYGHDDHTSHDALVGAYAERPQLRLHEGGTLYLDGERAAHAYGTAVLAHYLDEEVGGPALVQDTWASIQDAGGAAQWMPDVLAGLGLDWDETWADYLAHAAVLDLDATRIGQWSRRAAEVSRLPDDGEVPAALEPESLGYAVVRVAADTGRPGRGLRVALDLDGRPARWHAVLVRASGPGTTRQVDEVVPIDTSTGVGFLPDFDGTADAFIVLSPEDDDDEARGFHASWHVELARSERGGCTTTPSTWRWLAGAILVAAGRRRRRA